DDRWFADECRTALVSPDIDQGALHFHAQSCCALSQTRVVYVLRANLDDNPAARDPAAQWGLRTNDWRQGILHLVDKGQIPGVDGDSGLDAARQTGLRRRARQIV